MSLFVRLSLTTLVILSFCLWLAVPVRGQSEEPKFIRLEEQALRKRARKILMPRFPEDAKKRGVTGTSVAEVEIDETGKVASVRVVQAPDELIKVALTDAINQWRFRPLTIEGAPVRIIGKLTFHYVIDRGKASVENPKRPSENKQ